MRAFVFTDKALAKHAGQFVWLSIDSEKAQNAPFSKKYPIRAWPSLYVIDPQKEAIAMRWVGGANVSQLVKLFAQGERAVRGGARGAAEALAKADALYGEGKYAEAAPAYREAIRFQPVSGAEYPRAVEALLFCLQVTDQDAECVELARQALTRLRTGPSAANLAGSGLDCALQLPKEAPGRAEAVDALEGEARRVLANPKLSLQADDRSALFGTLVSAREDAGDQAGAHRLAREWVEYLDGQAAAAATPDQRTALDPNRLSAFEAAGELSRAIPMLEQSEKEFPEDYNPPARLAWVYFKLKRYDEALAASDRALELVYGPRKLRVLAVRTDIYEGMGDAGAARKTLEESLRYAEALPPGQRSESQIASLRKRLEGGSP